jgi:hypothetical protein
MAHVDFLKFKQPGAGSDKIQWFVVLLVCADESQHTRLEKTCNIGQFFRDTERSPPEGRVWQIGVASPVDSEVEADAFIGSLTNETKTRGCSSRSVVFERTAHNLGIKVYNDFCSIFKNPDAETLLVRAPTQSASRRKNK